MVLYRPVYHSSPGTAASHIKLAIHKSTISLGTN